MPVILDRTYGLRVPRPGYTKTDGDARQLISRTGSFMELLESGTVSSTATSGSGSNPTQKNETVNFSTTYSFTPKLFLMHENQNINNSLEDDIVYPNAARGSLALYPFVIPKVYTDKLIIYWENPFPTSATVIFYWAIMSIEV